MLNIKNPQATSSNIRLLAMSPAKGRQSAVFSLIWSDDVYQAAERVPKQMKAPFVGLYTEPGTTYALIRPQDL